MSPTVPTAPTPRAAALPQPTAPDRLRWPLPALLLWLACAALQAGLGAGGVGRGPALAAACTLGALAALRSTRPWRRLILALGYPALALASGLAAGLPAWLWLLPLALLLLAYPLHAWADAPMFPTPPDALLALATLAPLPAGAAVLDAGCGAGHGLRALRAAYPEAALEGIEWSAPWAALAALRCRGARVRRGDMWAPSWSAYRLVYLFQRPESMARAWAKACAELAPGSWLASLAFEVPGVTPTACVGEGRRRLWLYRIPAAPGTNSGADRAESGSSALKCARPHSDMQNTIVATGRPAPRRR